MDELKKYCDRFDVNYNGCFLLVVHLVSTGMKENDAIEHVKELIVDGTIDKINKLIKPR